MSIYDTDFECFLVPKQIKKKRIDKYLSKALILMDEFWWAETYHEAISCLRKGVTTTP